MRPPQSRGTPDRSPGVSPAAFLAHPPDLQPWPLMDMDFAIPCPLVRPSLPHYPISVRRVAISLHASFRQSLAVLPLRFTRASPPSGCTGDFHPQAAGHAQHTRVGARHARPARRSGRACAWLRSRRAVARRRCPALRAVAFGWCRGGERPDKSTRALAARRRTRSCVLVFQAEERSRPSGGPLAAPPY